MKLFKIFVGPSLVLIWLIANTIYVVKKLRKTIKDENKNTEILVKCENCETEHITNIDEILSTTMSKKIYTTKSINIGFFGLSTPNYKYFAKNCCPFLATLVFGSPIIQNGRLVGAITHVLIGDPTTGYGIFIENMLNAVQMPMARAS